MQKKILVTGSSGFIGAALTEALLRRGDFVVGIDNHNDYYEVSLKEARLARFVHHPHYEDLRMDLTDRRGISELFSLKKFNCVVHLAAQAGIRYSLINPLAYIDSNITGFAHILEACRHNQIDHLVYASSSSVYGANQRMPFSVHDNVDHPLSLYAASKKSNELMAHTYSHLYALPTTGLRFFTVYGPWGRPDMALAKFAKAIVAGKPIQLYNYGKHRRDFTYIQDIVESIIRSLDQPATPNLSWSGQAPDPATSSGPWRVYNVGSHAPVELIDYVGLLEKALGRNAIIELLPMQAGDVPDTYADIKDLTNDFSFRPQTPIEEGVKKYAEWFSEYYQIN